MKNYEAALNKLGAQKGAAAKPTSSRAAKRLFGSSGALEKIMRDEYRQGLAKLQANSFETKAEKDEWVNFHNDLSPQDLALVSDDN
jgi:hypothetical protein